MRKTYRATFFAIFYFSVLLVFAVVWFGWFSHFPPGVRPWGTLFLIALCLLGVPSLRAHVDVGVVAGAAAARAAGASGET